jgi:multiple sugar transport system substrate-binding protein
VTRAQAGRHREPFGVRRIATALLTFLLAACETQPAGPPVVNVYYAPEQHFAQVAQACEAEANGRYRVAYQVLPRGADDQRVQLARRLAARDTAMDVLGIDVTWTAELASARWILPWPQAAAARAEAGTLAAPLQSARWQGRLYGAPKNTNVQLLWYRTDLVAAPPRTWSELFAQADALRAKGQPYRVLTMGAQYEGLVVLYNTLTASAGGRLLDESGTTAVFDRGALRGLEVLQQLFGSGLTHPSFTNQLEDDVRLAYQSGAGAFQLNWPYVWAAMQASAPEVAAKTAWARYPAIDDATPSRVTLGGYNLAVSAYSRHPAEAFEVALCLRSNEQQRFSAVRDGLPPTLEALYFDPVLAKAYPMREAILAELKDAAVRPITPAYQDVSTVLAAGLAHAAQTPPEVLTRQLRDQVQAALESKGVLP